jgi:hypothetical protein
MIPIAAGPARLVDRLAEIVKPSGVFAPDYLRAHAIIAYVDPATVNDTQHLVAAAPAETADYGREIKGPTRGGALCYTARIPRVADLSA